MMERAFKNPQRLCLRLDCGYDGEGRLHLSANPPAALMSEDPGQARSSPPPEADSASFDASRSWQFSLKTLLRGFTSTAIFLGLMTALPVQFANALSQALVGLVWIVATGWLVVGLFDARGDQRAFCIGAMVVVSSTWSNIGGRFLQGIFQMCTTVFGGLRVPDFITQWLDLALIAAIAAANGWVCVLARRYFKSPPGKGQGYFRPSGD